jgi:integrase
LPKRALTDASVKRLPPPAKGQVDYFDRGYPGMALRVSYGGGKSFVYFYRVGGKLRRMTLGTYPAMSLAQAREAWREARGDVQHGRDPALSRKREKPATAFAGVAEEWLKRDQAQNKSLSEVRRILDRDVTPILGHRQMADIGRRDILDLIDGIADRGAPVMARRTHAHLHRLFRWSVGRGIIPINPMADLPKPGAETKRDRVLMDDELVAVWRGCEELGWPFGSAVKLLMLTGARREEIGALRWSEIHENTIRLDGSRTKNNEPHRIPLSAAALGVLGHCPIVGGSDLVFTTNGKTPVSGWSRAKAALDQVVGRDAVASETWRIHDLRRTVATGLQRLGISLQVIEAVLGHVSGSRAGVVGIYQRHSFDAEKAAALEAWGAHVMALVEGREPAKVLPIRGQR